MFNFEYLVLMSEAESYFLPTPVLIGLGLLSAGLFLCGNGLNFYSVLKGSVVPQRATWLTLWLIASTNLATQIAAKATFSLVSYITPVVGIMAVLVLSIRRGTGGGNRNDLLVLALCVAGLCVWGFTGNERVQILANLGAGVISLSPTFAKVARTPDTENASVWAIFSLGAAISAISVGRLDFDLVVIGVFWALLQGSLALVVVLFKRRESL